MRVAMHRSIVLLIMVALVALSMLSALFGYGYGRLAAHEAEMEALQSNTLRNIAMYESCKQQGCPASVRDALIADIKVGLLQHQTIEMVTTNAGFVDTVDIGWSYLTRERGFSRRPSYALEKRVKEAGIQIN